MKILKLVMISGTKIVVDNPYIHDPLNRIVHRIDTNRHWHQLKAADDDIIAEIQEKYVEAIIYKGEDE
jgi:hypothetical protein